MAERELTVALLMKDLVEAKELTQIFKKVGVHPHLYTDLKDFWQGTLERLPSLCVVDVRLMAQESLQLRHHPYVKAEQMPLSFFYAEEDRPLLFSTYEMFHLGLIRKHEPYVGQVKSMLRRLNKVMNLEEKAQSEGLKNSRYDHQLTKLTEKFEQLKERDYYHQLLQSLGQRFDHRHHDEDFFQSLEVVLGALKEVDEFAYFELATNGQKLIANESRHPKYRKLPSLWLGESCRNGIAPFAQSMAAQVGVDLMGSELMSLSLRGRQEHPDALLFLKVNDQNMLNVFDWEAFERMLSGHYAHLQWRQTRGVQGPDRWMQPFELLSLLDADFYGLAPDGEKVETEFRLIDLSFEGLVSGVHEKNMRFYWKIFFEDFLKKLQSQTHLQFRICPVGVEHVAFLVEERDFEKLFVSLKSYAARFPFWKYFEEPDTVLTKEWRPKVQQMPMASKGYLKALREAVSSTSSSSSHEEELSSLNENKLWGPAPEQNM